MKKYIRSADTLKGIVDVIRDRLLVDGVEDIIIIDRNSRFVKVKLLYDDGSESNVFSVRFDNKPNRREANTQWNPDWSIRDDGAVLNSDGSIVGWFKLTKKRPTSTTPDYKEDSIVVDYGTREIELTENSGRAVAKAVRSR